MAKFKKGQPRPKNAGRKKDTPNKSTATFRDSLMEKGFDIVKATVRLYENVETPPDIKFKCLALLAEYSYYKPKNPLDIPGALPERPESEETDLTDDEITDELDRAKT